MKELLELYLAFLRIGAVNFGGGYAMLPLLERDLVKDRGWTTTEDLTDYFAIGQCTPGLIALNVATFIGSRRKGVAGAIAATVGFVTIPIVIILLIATYLQKFKDSRHVQNALYGLRPASIAMITAAGLNVARVALVNIDAFMASRKLTDFFLWKAILLGIAIFAGQKLFPKIHPVAFIALSAAAGIIFRFAGV